MIPKFSDVARENLSRLPLTGNDQWDRDGVLYLPGLIPDALIDDYVAERTRLIGGTPLWRPGWRDPLPYLRVPTMMSLATHRPLTEAIRQYIGNEEPGLHLCLAGFQSTERAWHQDRYLNPEPVGERYIAAWIALEDVHPDAGPFEYVPGSHRWPVIERNLVWKAMTDLGEPPHPDDWPWQSEGWLGDACQAEINARGSDVRQFLGRRGDVLLWHASLMHRGSLPRNHELERRSLICHYSAISARPDMPCLRKLSNGSCYFLFQQ